MTKIVALIPAYNSAKTIEKIISRVPNIVNQVIVVDDGSSDGTSKIVKNLVNVKLIVHGTNKGYGGAQKTLMDAAKKENADICVFVHSDGGHRPEEIPLLIKPILKGEVKVVNGSRARKIIQESKKVLGSRFLGGLLYGPMPPHRFFGNRFLSKLQNIVCGLNVDDFHSGFRACTREVLEKVDYNKLYEGHGFDAEILLAICNSGYKIKSIPISTHYDRESKSTVKLFSYGLRVLKFIFENNRFRIRKI